MSSLDFLRLYAATPYAIQLPTLGGAARLRTLGRKKKEKNTPELAFFFPLPPSDLSPFVLLIEFFSKDVPYQDVCIHGCIHERRKLDSNVAKKRAASKLSRF